MMKRRGEIINRLLSNAAYLSGPCEKNTPSIAAILGGLGGDEFSHRSGFQSDE
jgi:hypothetical protein